MLWVYLHIIRSNRISAPYEVLAYGCQKAMFLFEV